jgi:hypothetical protein
MKNTLRIVGILAGVVSTVIGGAVAAQPAQAVPAVFSIVNYGSGLCLERSGSGFGSTDSATTLRQYAYDPALGTQPRHRHPIPGRE